MTSDLYLAERKKPFKILHLEDTSTDAVLIHRALKKDLPAAEILLVDNKEDFLNGLKNFSPQIIISDHTLPSFNSTQALRLLKELKIDIPFILVTSTISEEFAVEIMKSGADDYVLKDRLQRLPGAVINALEKHGFKKQQERNLQKILANEALMKEAEHLANFGSWQLDELTGITTWSAECYRLLQCDAFDPNMTFDNFLQFVHPADLQNVKDAINEVRKTHRAKTVNYWVTCKKGAERRFFTKMMVTKSEKGKAINILGFNQDITETYKAQEKLIKSEANLSTIFNNIGIALVLIDSNLEVITFNQLAVEYTRHLFEKDLTVGSFALSYFSDSRKSFIIEAIQKTQNGTQVSYEVNLPMGDNNRWFLVKWFNISHANESLGLIMAITDITQRKVAEIEKEKISNDLIRRNAALEKFNFIVSHNLRAPLANMLGIAKALIELDLNSDETKEFIDAMLVSTTRLDRTIMDLNNILSISKKQNEKKEIVSLRILLKNITREIKENCGDNAVTIHCDLPANDEVITVKSALYTILYQLISNSVKYRRPGLPPSINVKSYFLNGNLTLCVKDNGKGIDLKRHGNRLFGMYQRFDISVEGEGMGLCLAKTLTEALGGEISVESEVNKGTEFTITLPG